jgi:hypothetical protein
MNKKETERFLVAQYKLNAGKIFIIQNITTLGLVYYDVSNIANRLAVNGIGLHFVSLRI